MNRPTGGFSMGGRRHFPAILCCLIVLSAGLALAATFNGTVESVSVDDKSVTVKLSGKKEESKTFTLNPTAIILLDGKKATLEEVSDGQTVTVTANNSNLASKLVLKAPKVPVGSNTGSKKPSRSPLG